MDIYKQNPNTNMQTCQPDFLPLLKNINEIYTDLDE